ncbi:hypothetical protein BJV74DRAFT_304622 [Russula compacta]|nr:hypothetical protein BJV74DRAFT_304622 [Russula compacta]
MRTLLRSVSKSGRGGGDTSVRYRWRFPGFHGSGSRPSIVHPFLVRCRRLAPMLSH